MPKVKDWSRYDEDEMMDMEDMLIERKVPEQYRPVSYRQATQRRAEDGKNRLRRNKEWN